MHFRLMVLGVLVLAGTAHAQSFGPATYALRDTWTFSDGRTIQVAKVEENGVQMAGILRTCPDCIYHYDKNLTVLNVTHPDGKPIDLTQHGFIPLGGEWKFYDFPLEAKKTWRITPQWWFRGTPIKYTIDINVLAYEDVKTKAGTFKAFKIHRAWTVHGRSGDSRWTDETWFSPDVKFLVRFTTTSSAPGIQNFELVSYTVK